MEEMSCIFCKKSNEPVYIEENGYQGRKCTQCGLIFISPRPTPDEIEQLYSHDHAHLSAEDHISSSFVKRLYARHTLQLLRTYAREGALLEIGCGAGYFLDEARNYGFTPYGIELNAIQADFIQQTLHIPCEKSVFGSHSFEQKKFDIVYHCDVLSHFFDPIATFETIHSKLNPHGLLVFETGNLADVSQKHLSAIERFQYPDHLFFFGENSLRDLLERTGFELVKSYHYNILPQLKLQKLMHACTKRKTACNTAPVAGTRGAAKEQSASSRIKQLVKNSYHYGMYLIRYKLGYVLARKNVPQTVIVIARKRA